MKTRKSEIRSIMLDIIAGREQVTYSPDQQGHLFIGVAEVFERRSGKPKGTFNIFPQEPRLEEDDKLLALEVFWDLILDRIITPGVDSTNPLPFFRVHSEAVGRL